MTPDALQTKLATAAQFFAQGDRKSAADIYRDIVRCTPREPDALHMLGIIAQQAGNTELALNFIEAAIGVKPDFASAWVNRSVILRKAGRNADALHSARMAIEVAPELAEAWDLSGQILKEQADYNEAHICHKQALNLQPGNAAFHNNYALLLLAIDDQAGSLRALRQAEVLDPNFPPLLLGNVLRAIGHPEHAAACYARVRTLLPDFREATTSEAMARLQMGDLVRGWELWEQRPDLDAALGNIPLWRGENIPRLLLYEDQGLGDAIQFLRFIGQLHSRADHIALRVREPLRRLCIENFPRLTVLCDTDPVPPTDARCRLSSLPYIFATRLDSIPSEPYLTASTPCRGLWREKINNLPKPRIGVIWAGNDKFHNDRARSLKFNDLRPLLACGSGHFISLQKDRPETAQVFTQAGVFNAAPLLDDFATSAALIAELDLVVTVDTAVAHLAGALGKPVFILLPFDSDWRWLLGREDSPWYLTARLFRQKKPGNWTDVIATLAHEIRKFVAGDSAVLRPSMWQGENLRQNPDALAID
jgi:tetratricopeptide (TPR) repeat protein